MCIPIPVVPSKICCSCIVRHNSSIWLFYYLLIKFWKVHYSSLACWWQYFAYLYYLRKYLCWIVKPCLLFMLPHILSVLDRIKDLRRRNIVLQSSKYWLLLFRIITYCVNLRIECCDTMRPYSNLLSWKLRTKIWYLIFHYW